MKYSPLKVSMYCTLKKVISLLFAADNMGLDLLLFTKILIGPLFQPNCGGVPVGPDRRCCMGSARAKTFIGIISREIIFELFEPM